MLDGERQAATSAAASRVSVLQGHLLRGGGNGDDGINNDAAAAGASRQSVSAPDENSAAAVVHHQAPYTGIQYSMALPERLDARGPWAVRRSNLSPQELVTTFEDAPAVRTLHDNLEHAIVQYGQEPFLGQRLPDASGKPGPEYDWMSYAQAGAVRDALAAGLVGGGLAGGGGGSGSGSGSNSNNAAANNSNLVPGKDRIGLYSVNCRDWVLLDAAAHSQSLVSVPLYDTLGEDAVSYICGHAELAAVGCSAEALPTLLHALPQCPTVRLVVVFGLPPGGVPYPPPSGSTSARVVTIDELAAAGRVALNKKKIKHRPPSPDDVATICYTSGTTGVPKGAVLSHSNLIADAAGSFRILRASPGDVHVSYLPLAHIYERVTVLGLTHCGAAVGFYSGDVQALLDDVLLLRPTIFCSVPRLWNRIYDRVLAQVRSGSAVARRLFEAAYASKRASLLGNGGGGGGGAGSGGGSGGGGGGGGITGAFWDALVFSKIRAKLGGRVRLMTTGASPISGEVIDFMRVCFGATVVEGYGMTETACTISLTLPEDVTSGHVGGPVPCCEVKLADIPEMNYCASDVPNPRGEVCVRGPTVFRGYHKDEEQTREILDGDGWLHTGDVGEWLPGGRLKIIDRKKNIFKLAQGEYIAPEKIEGIYGRSPLVAQAFVYGDSLRPQLVAVVVPDAEELAPWAKAHGLGGDLASLCAHPAVRDAVLKSMLDEGRSAKLRGFEQVAAVALSHELFSVENGLLTPTFKLKRPQAKQAFQAQIDAMYAGLST